MPYRRLPNTDAARLAALETITYIKQSEFKDPVLSAELLNKAAAQFYLFRHQQDLYRQAVDRWQDNNLKYRDIIVNLTRNITEFVKAYYTALETGEIGEESRRYYNITDYEIPDLSCEVQILDWAKRLVEGERRRIFEGGIPITNPTISNLSIYYDRLEDLNFSQNTSKNTIDYTREKLIKERQKTDDLIRNLWNTIEAAFEHLSFEERIEECRKYGVVYYDRPSERTARNNNSSESTTKQQKHEYHKSKSRTSKLLNQKVVLLEIPFDDF